MKSLGIVFLVVMLFCAGISAQTTAFTYQGSMQNSGTPAYGNFDFEFKLFDAVSSGAQQGSTIQRLNVAVANGIFTVNLDFGAGTLSGADRFLEIGVRVNGNPGGFQQLLPRQPLASSPYSVRSLNSTELGGVAANQYVVTTDPRMTDARNPLPGSSNYIQNQNAGAQAASNFNISGNGTAGGTLSANVVNAASQYNIGGSHVLSIGGTNNTFAGVGAGLSNLTGGFNSFFGTAAGENNTTGMFNSSFGRWAGRSNTTGESNAFFGFNAGTSNNTGGGNTFIGAETGLSNTTGFVNTLIGYAANVGSGNLVDAIAIGTRSRVDQSNSMVLGPVAGTNGASVTPNVGIGTTAPANRLHIVVNGGNIHFGGAGCSSGNGAIGFGTTMTGCSNYSLLGEGTNTVINRPTGGSIVFRENNTTQMTLASGGLLSIATLGAAGATTLCRNASSQISSCSSSLRYKTNIGGFSDGVSFVNKLRPISFDRKDGGMKDVGFGAEDIAKIDPRFVTYNSHGEVEGVKYDRLSVAFVNAFREQQEQIEKQKTEAAEQKALNQKLQSQIDNLTKIVCSLKPDADGCTQQEK